jgi:hypothetical protein
VVLPNRTAKYTVEFTRTTKPFGQFGFGSLTWRDFFGHSVRSPIAVRPVQVAAPAEITGTGASGSVPLAVRSGYSGTLASKPLGLVASQVSTKHLVGVNTTFDPNNPAEGDAVGKVTVAVPSGTAVARFATFGSQYPLGTDVDLFVYSGGALVGVSAHGTADEQVTLGAGTYDVYVVQFATVGVGEQDVFLHSFIVPPAAAGNLTATPASRSVTTGQAVTVTAGWSGLTPGRHYLGLIQYTDATTVGAQTLVTVHA